MELTAGGSYSMRNSLIKLENLQGQSTKKPHSLEVFYFDLEIFKRCNTLLSKLICYDRWVLQNFQDKSNLIGVFAKAFPQPSCLFFIFLEQTTDDLGAEIPCSVQCVELFSESLQNKTCYRLNPK